MADHLLTGGLEFDSCELIHSTNIVLQTRSLCLISALPTPSQAQKGSALADVQLPLDGTQAGGYLGLLTSAGDNCPVSHRLQTPSSLKLQSLASSHTF